MTEIQMIEEKDFQELVINAPNPVVVTFVRSGCVTCGVMKRVIARIAKTIDGVTFYGMDAEINSEFAKGYQLAKLPAHIMFSRKNPIRAKLGHINGLLFRRWVQGKPLPRFKRYAFE